MIWNETKECMSRDEMTALQSARLVKLVDYVYHNVEFYRKKMQAVGLIPSDIKGIEDITKLPFTTKDDLRDNYPFGLFAVPQTDLIRIHASSGTTGKPTVVGYTEHDIDVWAQGAARALVAAGATTSRVSVDAEVSTSDDKVDIEAASTNTITTAIIIGDKPDSTVGTIESNPFCATCSGDTNNLPKPPRK